MKRAVIETLESRQLLSVNVLTWHNDAGRTGLNPNEQILTPANVNSSSFGELFSYPVSGQVYAQPLYVSNLAIAGKGTHNVVFVVTMNNDVYALDANSNSGAGAGVLWHVNLGPAATVPNSFIGFRYGPDHDTTPQVGITSTPVIDVASGTIFIDAFTNDVAGQDSFSHHIHALDISTGLDKVTPMLVAASVKGNGVGGNGTTVPFTADRQLQRVALTLLNNTLYVAYGAFADTDPYHGWVLGFNTSTLQLLSVLNTTPNLDTDSNAGEGGFWEAGGGLASDGTHLFAMSGNGDFNPAVGDYSDSFLSITPDSSTVGAPNITGYGLKVTDYFTPYNEQALADADADLGSGGPMALPDQPGPNIHEIIGAGKQGLIYVVNRDNMGQHNTSTDNVIQTVSLGHGIFSTPAYYNSSVYFHAVGDVLKRFSLTNGRLSAAPAAQSSVTYSVQGAGSPSISSNGTANGIVWESEWTSAHQVLHAYDATTLTELYNSNQVPGRDQIGNPTKFVVPTVADGEVFIGSTGRVTIYGLLVPVTAPPAAPTGASAVANTSSSITVNWVDNSNTESGFKVERSVDNVNFSQIALVGVNVISYVDTSVSPSTLYYYRVRATNAIGDSAYTVPSASATTPSATGAVDIFSFDAGTGTTAIDSAGGNNGTLVGSPLPQWVTPGKVGNAALSFSGDGTFNQASNESAVSVGSDLSTILGSSSTLDVWVQTTQTGGIAHWQSPAITGADLAGAANDINWGTLDPTGHIGLYVGDNGGVYSTNPINDGQWHNIAMTRDATTGLAQIYVDGILNNSASLGAGNMTTPFYLLGALSDVAGDGVTRTGANYFNGKLDEVRIYSQALGPAEIAGIAGVPPAPTFTSATIASGPVAHLVFSSSASYTTSLEIDRKIGVNGTYSVLATVPGAAIVYDDTTVATGQSYYYIIKAIDFAGTSTASSVLSVTPPIPVVVGNFVFYNNSFFDGQNGSSNLTDINAIATDKQALLPGGTATFSNYTSYSKGLNGIMIDVSNLTVLPRLDDFSFIVGNNNTPSSWVQAPTPEFINSYPGRGPGGSTQITVIWTDNSIQNEWLQVTLLAQPHLGLSANDVFYFGNAIGDTGDSTTNAFVNSADAARVTANQAGSVPVTNIYDINRDGAVNGADVTVINNNPTSASNALNLISLSGGVAPVLVTAAASTPGAVAATTAMLSVLGTDNVGGTDLNYSWITSGAPAAAVSFSVNGTNTAKNTTVTFAAAGTYNFQVAITNQSGYSAISSVTVVVNQTATTISITPASSKLAVNSSTQLTAVEMDQFGNAMAAQPTFTWSVTAGGGGITPTGLFTSSRTAGQATITASASGLSSAGATVTASYDVLAWYQSDASSGSTLADSSTFNQTAALTGSYGFSPGVSGNAVAFSGGYATLPAGVVGSLNDFTIATWVNLSAVQNWSRIFDIGTGTATNMFLTPDAGGTNALRFAITVAGNGAEEQIDGPPILQNTWTHVAVTLTGNIGTLYVNGYAVATNTGIMLHPTMLGATTQNFIGKSQYVADPALQGSVDDFRIYSRALSPQQVLQLAVPAVVAPAAASTTPVVATTTSLTVLGSDVTAGESALTYTWASIGIPPAPVTFSINGTNAAKSTTATFTKTGTYNFNVTIVNPAAGLTTTSSVTVNVIQGVTTITVSPSSTSISDGQTTQLTATGYDQFGAAMSSQPTFTWSIVGGGAGSVNSTGLYSAPASGPGIATVRATSGAGTGSAAVNVILSNVAGTPANDNIRLVRNGANLSVYINNPATPAYTVPFATLGGLTVTGGTGTDTVNVDFSGGASPVPLGGLTINGSTGSDTLTITGTSGNDTAVVNATTITFDGSPIVYSQVGSILINGNGGADTLTQSAQPGNAATLALNGGLSGGPSSSDTLNVNAGGYIFAPAAAGSGLQPLSLANLSIGSGATVMVATATAHSDRWLLNLGSLGIAGATDAWTGQLNLGGNDMVVHGGNLAVLTNEIKSGYDVSGGGDWAGKGITSSAVASDPRHLTALGIILNAGIYGSGAGSLGLFDGINPVATDVLIKDTYLGDTNLDGQVDGSDYTKIDNGFNNHLTGWGNGNFNYDNFTDGSDYTLIDNAFNTQGASLAAIIAGNASQLAPASTARSIGAAHSAIFSNSALFPDSSSPASDVLTADKKLLESR